MKTAFFWVVNCAVQLKFTLFQRCLIPLSSGNFCQTCLNPEDSRLQIALKLHCLKHLLHVYRLYQFLLIYCQCKLVGVFPMMPLLCCTALDILQNFVIRILNLFSLFSMIIQFILCVVSDGHFKTLVLKNRLYFGSTKCQE